MGRPKQAVHRAQHSVAAEWPTGGPHATANCERGPGGEQPPTPHALPSCSADPPGARWQRQQADPRAHAAGSGCWRLTGRPRSA